MKEKRNRQLTLVTKATETYLDGMHRERIKGLFKFHVM